MVLLTNMGEELKEFTFKSVDFVVERTYGRLRYILKKDTKCNTLILQQELIERRNDEVKKEWISVPLELEE